MSYMPGEAEESTLERIEQCDWPNFDSLNIWGLGKSKVRRASKALTNGVQFRTSQRTGTSQVRSGRGSGRIHRSKTQLKKNRKLGV